MYNHKIEYVLEWSNKTDNYSITIQLGYEKKFSL